MSSNIDWVMVIVNCPIDNYLDKNKALPLSLTNKRIRVKLYPILFKELTINSDALLSYPNYFKQKKYYRFDNLSYIEKIKKLKKYGLNDQLAFKELQIDPFIEEANTTLKSGPIHCKSLSLYFPGFLMNDRVCYFIFPLFENFCNLKNLVLIICEIPFIKFYKLLAKLENLQILDMQQVNLILIPNETSNSSPNLQFPKSLKKLTYEFVMLGITSYPETTPIQFLRDIKRDYHKEFLNLLPQYLPNLKSLNYDNYDGYHFNENWNVREFEKFLSGCPTLEYVYRPRFY
jgi:hypothetical protein